MKKLIALAAIATCGAALAVESANIVGYTTKTIPQNVYTMYGPSFASVGGVDAIAIKDISFPATESGDTMLLIDPVTAAYTSLTYVTAEGAGDEGLADGAGWYDFTGDDPVYMGNTLITRGCAFWLFAGSGNVSSVTSGEVKSSFSRTLPQNLYSAFANPFPMNKPIKDFNYPATESGDTMLLIDLTTAAYTTLTYVTAEGADDEGLADGAGWYDFTGDDPVYMSNSELAPGQGCWIFPGSGSITITATL